MNGNAIFVLILAGGALVLFVTEIVATDIVALSVLVGLGLSGILDLPTLFSGFGNPVILTLIGIFMLTAALRHTGVTAYVSQFLLRMTQKAGERTIVGLLALAAGVASMMMNTVASSALIAPIGRHIALKRNISPSHLLMPIAYGALLGGMATLLTTSNLLVASLLTERGLPSFNLLDFVPVGGPIALVGIIYLTLFSSRLLPERSPSDQWQAIQQARYELTRTYQLGKRLFEAYVEPGSPLGGKTLVESNLGHEYGITAAALVRGRRNFAPIDAAMRLQIGDWLLLQGKPDDVVTASIDLNLSLINPDENVNGVLFASDSELAEVALSPRNELIGRTLGEINFREKYGLNVLALWHEGRPIRSHLAEQRLSMGDALLVQGRPEQLNILCGEPDFVVMTHLPEIPEHTERAATAIVILAVFLFTIAFNWLPIALAALLGAIAVIVTGCETVEQARASIQWQAIFLIGGMLPLAKALEQTGATSALIHTFPYALEVWGPQIFLLIFFLVTMGLAQFTSGQAATLIIGPLAISTALQTGLNPLALAITIAIGASTAFLSPVSHPANLLVLGPGGYQFRDYAKLGFPLVLITAIGVVMLVPLVYPF